MHSTKYISKLISIFFALTTFITIEAVNAQEVTMGDFSGQWNTTVTSGVAVRTTDRNCLLVSGRLVGASVFEAGVNPAVGNGGCAQTYVDHLGNTSSATSIVGVNTDDGNLNFDGGDVIDATQTVSSELILSNGSVGLNFSGVTSYNPLLDITTPAFKKLTDDAEDELESKFVLNNAYATFGGVSGDTFVDVTVGRYVESLGTTAFMPIGVNVVNAVDLSILRAPGASIKDALIPQEMLGVSLGTPSGVSINGYYQVNQQELILDPAGAFFGSEVAGTGSTGILKAVNPNEAVAGTTKFYGDAYYNVTTSGSGACDLVDGNSAAPSLALYGAHVLGGGNIATYLANFSCTREADGTARTALVMSSTDTETQANTYFNSIATHMGSMTAGTVGTALQSTASAIEGVVINATVAGATNHNNLRGNGCKALGCTDADIINGFTLFAANAPDVKLRRALLNQNRAADKEARDDGQFGINLTGYSEMGGGIDWGLYYSNYHSKIPYTQMLAIRGLNSIDMWSALSDNGTTNWTSSSLRTSAAQINTNFKYSAEALGYQVLNAVLSATTDAAKDAYTGLMDTAGVNDAGKAYAIYAMAGKDAAMGAAALSAYSALQPTDRSLYQLYYPEDIQVFGASASTVIDGTAVTAEVAYRPDMPLQISAGDQISNMFDSTGGSAMEAQGVYLATIAGLQTSFNVPTYTLMSAANAAAAASAAFADYDTIQWSGMADCDITSSGVASTVTGYNECKGHKNLDVWTANATAVKSFNATHPFTNLTGADGSFLLVELGMVHVPSIENTNGVVSSGQFQIGNGYCDGVAGNAARYQNFALFKNGLLGDKYCQAAPGASKTASAYKVRSGWNFNNFNNSPWSVNTSVGWDHDFSGNAPSSIGGFVEGKMRLTLGATANKGSVSMSLNYTDQMGDEKDNSQGDKDYVSYSVSYAF
jgi:hypothetical protein